MSGFRKIFPSNERQLLDGGLNSKFAPSIIEANESPDCLNVIFKNGAVETREGYSKFNTTAVGSFVGDGLYTRRANDSSETMCAFWNGLMYTAAGTTFNTVPSAQSVFTAGVRVASAQDENYIFFCNGNVNPYKWNGTTFTRHGVPAPTGTITVGSANVVGALTASGQYNYKTTYVNSNLVESDVGPISSTFVISSTSGQNTLSVIPIAPQSFGVNQRYLYRTSGTGTTFYRLATLADNTTTTYTDNTPDSSLGAAAPTDAAPPPKWNTIIYHQSRLFCNDSANPNYLWYSNLGNPYTFPLASNFIRVGDNTSDLIKSLGVFDNALVVFCETSIWLIYMADTTPSNWKTIRINSSFGSKSQYCVLNFNNKVLFPAVQNTKFTGFAALKGNTIDTSTSFLTVSTAGSEMKSDRIEPDMFTVQESYLGNISGIVYKNKAWIALTYDTGNTTNNRVYQMDFSISNLKKDQEVSWVPFTGINASQFTIYTGKLYFQSSTATGRVYQLETGLYSDDGSAINSYFWTKEYSGQPEDTNITKDFRFGNFLVDAAGNYYMNLTYKVDSTIGNGTVTNINLNPGGSLWGVFTWGTDLWGGGKNQNEVRQYFAGARGIRIQFMFSNQNTVNQRFKVHGMNLFYNQKGYR